MAPLSRHETRGSESTVPERPDPEEDLLAARPHRRRRLSMDQPPSFEADSTGADPSVDVCVPCTHTPGQDLADLRAGSVK
ncbi:unnamed protein product [Arctogadus glacialis]